uniref:Putative 4'-phosphopantetheinyl transferase n=1 Tax=Streptomyces griseoviridis TaxID=45398 RepID=B6VRR9_STRGD|nr:putative 4'-phosphopantetheinyl transferase [Streptomyces griseoviridis]
MAAPAGAAAAPVTPAVQGAPPGLPQHAVFAGGRLFDAARPLHTGRAPGARTLSVVSIAWLRAQPPSVRAALERRHLSPAEAEFAETLQLPKRRLEWLAGRLALKHGVCSHRRVHGAGGAPGGHGAHARTPLPRDIQVSAVRDGLRAGKPTVNAPVEVGLSHSADFAVAVSGQAPVGVDLEHSRDMPPMLARLLAGDGDAAARTPGRRRLAAMPLPLRWACREAVLKHFGFGLRVDPCEVALTEWDADGGFHWRYGPQLRRLVSPADARGLGSWAREIDGYFLALVWKW